MGEPFCLGGVGEFVDGHVAELAVALAAVGAMPIIGWAGLLANSEHGHWEFADSGIGPVWVANLNVSFDKLVVLGGLGSV